MSARTPSAKTPPAHAMKIEIEKRASSGGGGGDMATPVTEVGVARATRMAMQAKAQVETLLTFGDLDADYVEAAPTNKMILTPLLGGVSSELIEVDEGNRAAKTCAFIKKNWLFMAGGWPPQPG
jgi:broad specificity phosphatase PhoE